MKRKKMRVHMCIFTSVQGRGGLVLSAALMMASSSSCDKWSMGAVSVAMVAICNRSFLSYDRRAMKINLLTYHLNESF